MEYKVLEDYVRSKSGELPHHCEKLFLTDTEIFLVLVEFLLQNLSRRRIYINRKNGFPELNGNSSTMQWREYLLDVLQVGLNFS